MHRTLAALLGSFLLLVGTASCATGERPEIVDEPISTGSLPPETTSSRNNYPEIEPPPTATYPVVPTTTEPLDPNDPDYPTVSVPPQPPPTAPYPTV